MATRKKNVLLQHAEQHAGHRIREKRNRQHAEQHAGHQIREKRNRQRAEQHAGHQITRNKIQEERTG